MKTLISIILVSLPLGFSFAQPLKGLSQLEVLCVTEFPTTSFIGQTEGGKLKVKLINSNGVQYMPIHEGLVTSEDLLTLQKRAEILKELGTISRFEFELKNCDVFKDGTFLCEKGSQFQTPSGKKFEAYSLSSHLIKHSFQDIEFEETEMTANLLFEGESFFVSMKYSNDECGISYQK